MSEEIKIIDDAFQNLTIINWISNCEYKSIESYYKFVLKTPITVIEKFTTENKKDFILNILLENFYILEIFPNDKLKKHFFALSPCEFGNKDPEKQSNSMIVFKGVNEKYVERFIHAIKSIEEKYQSNPEEQKENKNLILEIALEKCIDYYVDNLAGKRISAVKRRDGSCWYYTTSP